MHLTGVFSPGEVFSGSYLLLSCGFVWVGLWVGLGHGSISSPSFGLGCVRSVIWWVGLGWVDENRPTDYSDMSASFLLLFVNVQASL